MNRWQRMRRRLVDRYILRVCPYDVVDGLLNLYREYPDCRGIIDGAFHYATTNAHGKHKLKMFWIDNLRVLCERDREFWESRGGR